MRRKFKQEHKEFKSGEFVFAKLKGYRPWPARVLQLRDRKYNVFFYGTCNRATVSARQLCTYATYKLRLGNLHRLRHIEFKRAMLHAEQAVANPAEDHKFYDTLSILEHDYMDAVDMELYDEYLLDDNNNDNKTEDMETTLLTETIN